MPKSTPSSGKGEVSKHSPKRSSSSPSGSITKKKNNKEKHSPRIGTASLSVPRRPDILPTPAEASNEANVDGNSFWGFDGGWQNMRQRDLYEACQTGNVSEVVQILQRCRAGLDLTYTGPNGENYGFLSAAAAAGHKNICVALLSHVHVHRQRVDLLRVRTASGLSASSVARQHGHLELSSLLAQFERAECNGGASADAPSDAANELAMTELLRGL